jgi:hypothetical protein
MNFLKKTALALVVISLSSFNSKENTTTIKVKNTLKKERSNETVALSKQFLKIEDLTSLGIRDKKTGEVQITQTVDNDGDGVMDELLFQPKIGAKSKKEYTVFQISKNQRPKTEVYCYSRFVPERTDDYAWENNKVAFRTYGPTAQKMIEEKINGGTLSSGIDAWLKRVEHPIINKWYAKMTSGKGTYHEDTGEGLDNFHVGSSRGIGGTAVKIENEYYISRNFVTWKTITTGPIRTSFILTYADWDAAGNKITETKKISLDYGSFLSKFEISVTGTNELSTGLTLHDKKGTVNSNFKEGWLTHWEKIDDSEIGTGIIVPNKKLISIENYVTPKADLSNHYASVKVVDDKVMYYAGFGWKKQGTFTTKQAWESYLSEFAEKANTPLVVRLKK